MGSKAAWFDNLIQLMCMPHDTKPAAVKMLKVITMPKHVSSHPQKANLANRHWNWN